ncbi:C40 family peptidase [Fulvivirga lutea]|uniref:C40 family peptidase n=1 Tax=Fulvivirga lutea TaxID=2810512 RepID=A0A974WFB5_9BACT|nr:C40 family peptidase [Fulvivirga lutea]QSE97424.1 C40 family peptidase [Fulvivirga lutea]
MKLRFIAFALLALVLASCGAAKKARIREQKINTVISTARSYTGTPYRWGGTSRSGIDCSGLLCNSFRAVDYELPRTSDAQSKVGKKVKEKDLRPGDLVFFATGKRKRKITHVGLVTYSRKGTVKFIHSSSSLGVVENSLSSDYYKKRFRTARRPF